MLQRKLSISLLVAYFLLALASLYFFFFPSLFNPLLDDISIGILMFVCITALVYACLLVQSAKDVALVLLAVVLLSLLARAIPNLRLCYPPLHDPYFYFVSYINISDYGTLQPVLGHWYPMLDAHLHWPGMHLLTSAMGQATGIDDMWLLRFAAPLLGGMFSPMVFLLGKVVTKNNSVALLAALFATTSDVVIFYQAKYHPQGLGLFLFVAVVYLWLKLIEKGGRVWLALFGICAGACLISHHFSSLYIGLLVLSFVIANELLCLIYKRRGFSLIAQAMANLRRSYVFLICFGGAVVLYHFVIYPAASHRFMITAMTPPPVTPVTPVTPPGIMVFGVPLLTFLFRLAKWAILFLGVASIVRILRKPSERELGLILLLGLIMLGGVLGMVGILGQWMAGIPVDRFIAFYAPLISIFAAMTVQRVIAQTKFSVRRTLLIKGATILGVAVLLTAGFFNAQIPAFYFKSSGINARYWYSNRLPVMEQYKAAGEWIKEYTPDDSSYGTELHTHIIPFFYGRKPSSRLNSTSTLSSLDYALINPTVPYWYKDYKVYQKSDLEEDLNSIYSNGELVLYHNNYQEDREC